MRCPLVPLAHRRLVEAHRPEGEPFKEFVDGHGNKKVAFWMKIEFHKRVGLREDTAGRFERETYK